MKLTKNDILNAHKVCCPSWVNPKNEEERGLLDDGRCGSGYKKCDGKCWYMKTFKKLLDF